MTRSVRTQFQRGQASTTSLCTVEWDYFFPPACHSRYRCDGKRSCSVCEILFYHCSRLTVVVQSPFPVVKCRSVLGQETQPQKMAPEWLFHHCGRSLIIAPDEQARPPHTSSLVHVWEWVNADLSGLEIGPHKFCQFTNSLQYFISEYKLNNSGNNNYKTTYLIYVISSKVCLNLKRKDQARRWSGWFKGT